MCLLIVNRAKAQKITLQQFKAAWEHNPHGGGFAYSDKKLKQVIIVKDMCSYIDLYQAYTACRIVNDETDFIIHFRYTTHGTTSLDNCHPFLLPKSGYALAHNGVISNNISQHGWSDTRQFANDLNQIPQKLLRTKIIKEMIESYIGHSKVAILSTGGKATIYNSNLGHNMGGNWYSNYSYISREVKPMSIKAPRFAERNVPGFNHHTSHTCEACLQAKRSYYRRVHLSYLCDDCAAVPAP